MKKIILIILSIFFVATNVVIARNIISWKEIKQTKNNKIKVFYDELSLERNKNFITYTLHYKERGKNDYVTVMYTNCADFSSAILKTDKYTKNYITTYDELDYNSADFKTVAQDSVLYDVASVICIADLDPVITDKSLEKTEILKSVGTAICGGALLIIQFLPVLGSIF